MDSEDGPISITALLAASHQQGPLTINQPQSLPPLSPKLQQHPQQYPHQYTSNLRPEPQLQKPAQIAHQYQHSQGTSQVHSEYYAVPPQIAYRNYQQKTQNISIPQTQNIIPIQMISQLPTGMHILSHHNLSPTNISAQPIPIYQQSHTVTQQPIGYVKKFPIVSEVSEEKVAPCVLLPAQQIVAQPIPRVQTQNFKQFFQPPIIAASASRIPRATKINELFIESDDKLLSKVSQMQHQIDKLSRAIIKKDNQELSAELNLNQIIEEKDKILQRKNKQLEVSSRRIKHLIEESQRKDLEIQKLKLQIQKVNRINNLSANFSRMEDVQIRNDFDVIGSAYLRDLMQESHQGNKHSENYVKCKSKEMIPTRQPAMMNVHADFISPTSINLGHPRQASEQKIYKLSGQRNYY